MQIIFETKSPNSRHMKIEKKNVEYFTAMKRRISNCDQGQWVLKLSCCFWIFSETALAQCIEL